MIASLMNRSEDLVMILLNLSKDEITMALDSFGDFKKKFPIFDELINIEPFNFKCDSDLLEFIFLQSIAKVSSLKFASSKFTR